MPLNDSSMNWQTNSQRRRRRSKGETYCWTAPHLLSLYLKTKCRKQNFSWILLQKYSAILIQKFSVLNHFLILYSWANGQLFIYFCGWCLSCVFPLYNWSIICQDHLSSPGWETRRNIHKIKTSCSNNSRRNHYKCKTASQTGN